METGKTLFLLRNDTEEVYDGSVKGISIVRAVQAKPLELEMGVRLEGGYLELARNPELDGLQSFTLEATIEPNALGRARQTVMESQNPAVGLYVEPDGKLTGAVHTAAGWMPVESGEPAVAARSAVQVRLVRHEDGLTELQVGDATVGSAVIPGPVAQAGELGFKIGAAIDGATHPFAGRIANVAIRQGAAGRADFSHRKLAAERQTQAVTAATGIADVRIHWLPDVSRARLQPIKDIMNAAGVERLSDLATLTIRSRTVMTPGKIMVAPRFNPASPIKWTEIAFSVAMTADPDSKRKSLAKYLVNRNSAPLLRRAAAGAVLAGGGTVGRPIDTDPPRPARPDLSDRLDRPSDLRLRDRRGLDLGRVSLPTNVLRERALKPLHNLRTTIGDLIGSDANDDLTVKDAGIVDRLEARRPIDWPNLSAEPIHLYTLKSIPLNSAVIIANTLDLTETELVIEPNVTTCYIIAERIVCGENAAIRWRRPGGETPPRLDNPDLNGRGWSGVHTKPDSRDGLNGEDGRAGEPGIDGARGAAAPHLEIWVRDMSAMPNIDLSGEEGRRGGTGQHGGHGGEGADGKMGERFWAFGWHCSADPGDGGEGGDGGAGGRGGRGGSGGNGGNLTIGVLDGTLEATVTSRAFKLKNHGGAIGRGGEGGAGGFGGAGGRSGVGDTCRDARDGRAGGQGQPGPAGSDGAYAGVDGSIRFFEFTEDAWEDLLERPWLSEISPNQAFPGDRLTLRGSRFTTRDRVVFAGSDLVPTLNADESLSVVVPLDAAGGPKTVYVRREDGTESNRLDLRIKPQLDPFSDVLAPNAEIRLNGRAFLTGAAVLVNGSAVPAHVESRTALRFVMPGTGGAGSAGGSASLEIRNPDGLVSNSRTASIPRVLEIPFRYGMHNLLFGNFTDGVPSWGTFEDTFGTAEVWHELLDPMFGHPVLTAAYYGFYQHFLKGEANGGLATGFCTSLASLVADNLWQGRNDTHTLNKTALHEWLTAVHGRLLSRESLIHFHDQSRDGAARIEKTFREVESTFLRGCDRHNAPLLFFIPSGAVWDAGYLDKIGGAHCVMPYRFVYPSGHPGPQLSADGTTTIGSLDGVELYVWDCNKPVLSTCKLVFQMNASGCSFEYFTDSAAPTFRSQDGLTLGMMTNGQYLLSDHDLPFGGPFGLTRFVIDFLLSPADLQITDENGLTTGRFGSELRADIPDSHPCYLLPGAYLLPENVPLTRKIVGTGNGTYTYNSILPSGFSLVLSDVATQLGHEDILTTNADCTQLRFTAAASKSFTMTLSRQEGDQVRAIAVKGVGAGPAEDLDITLSPELSLIRVGNRNGGKVVDVQAFVIDKAAGTPQNNAVQAVNLPVGHDLIVSVPDWSSLQLHVETLSFT